MKVGVYSSTTHFYYVNVGRMGVHITQACYPNVTLI